MKLLVVEDETELLDVIQQSLEKQSYIVETASTFADAMEKIVSFEYDCILLDIMLPDGSGLQLLDELKKINRSNNVIIISAKDSLEDKLAGLDGGADDYLVKPFHLAELNARVKSVVRRKSLNGNNQIELAQLSVDLQGRLATVNKK